MEENLPPGFRFHPTDEELITYYLLRKVSDISFTSKVVAVVDLNKSEPWDLPGIISLYYIPAFLSVYKFSSQLASYVLFFRPISSFVGYSSKFHKPLLSSFFFVYR